MLTPEERTLRARIAAHRLHATHDPKETSAKGRAAFLSRFEKEVDPDGTLSPEERHRRAEHAKKAYFSKLALQSARARRGEVKKKEVPDISEEAPDSLQATAGAYESGEAV